MFVVGATLVVALIMVVAPIMVVALMMVVALIRNWGCGIVAAYAIRPYDWANAIRCKWANAYVQKMIGVCAIRYKWANAIRPYRRGV